MAEVIQRITYLLKFLVLFSFIPFQSNALEIIRDTELEQFTYDILSTFIDSGDNLEDELNIYFIKSDQVNAFVTGGKNIFINTETIIEADDYREYASVLAHELAHIKAGHVFSTSIEISNLSNRALPVYLLGIIGIMAGSSEAGLAGVMVGQASVNDSFTYYSRTQEASADQAAVGILCNSGISAKYLISFLKKLKQLEGRELLDKQNYRSTHPLTENRITWINSSLKSYDFCNHKEDKILKKRFELLKAKLHGFTHHYSETKAFYNSDRDVDLYANAVSNYFQGEHKKSIKNLELLIKRNPNNPFYYELIGEIYFVNNEYKKAAMYQEKAIEEIDVVNDLYLMMIGSYLLSFEEDGKTRNGINFLRKSIQINSENSYSWYLLARAYAQINEIPLANYATAERYYLIGENLLSYKFANKALKNIEEYSPEWYRSSDLIEILKKEVSNRQ